jgi:hypothetical protein
MIWLLHCSKNQAEQWVELDENLGIRIAVSLGQAEVPLTFTFAQEN